MWTRVNRHTCNLYSVVECASLQGLSSDLREGSGCTVNTQYQSPPSPLPPPPPPHRERTWMLSCSLARRRRRWRRAPSLPSQQTATGAFYKADKVRTHTNGMPTTCSAQPAQSAWCLCHVHGTPLLHSCMCQPGLQGLCGRGCGPLSAPNSVCLCSYLCMAVPVSLVTCVMAALSLVLSVARRVARNVLFQHTIQLPW